MSKYIHIINLSTGNNQRVHNDTEEDLSEIYNTQNPIILGNTHYIDTDTLKLVVCKKATQSKKAWESIGGAEEDRPPTPWAVYRAESVEYEILAIKLAKYIIFYYKNNA